MDREIGERVGEVAMAAVAFLGEVGGEDTRLLYVSCHIVADDRDGEITIVQESWPRRTHP